MGSVNMLDMQNGVHHKHDPQIPHLMFDRDGTPRLFVKGKPFFMLAAELQNSSFSCPDYMSKIWPKLVQANINTILAAVTWEQIESVEDVFDFSTLDRLISDARHFGIRIILLWFGSFKNAMSTYVPSWVKTNPGRFPRAQLKQDSTYCKTIEALSIFHGESCSADAKAFAQLMKHLKSIDEAYSTVIMVQVENEVGILGDSRDRSTAAEKSFVEAVPLDFILNLRKNWPTLHASLKANLQQFMATENETQNKCSWQDLFGAGPKTDELFMAYNFAKYVETVAAAGKKEYALPLFTNVWQNYGSEDADRSVPVVAGGGSSPGDYPSGGSVIEVLDIWQMFAPTLSFIAPDIYLNDYQKTCRNYKHRGQPLLIPEQRRDEYGARRIWAAYGEFQALCAAPFGIDTLEPEDNPLTKHYGLLAQVAQHISSARRDQIIGFFFDDFVKGEGHSSSKNVRFGNWILTIERSFVFGKPSPGFGMIIHRGGARFLLVGEGFQLRFHSNDSRAIFTGILSFVEKEVINQATGEMRTCRMLNGDETRSGQQAIMPSEEPDSGGFPISITIPARTRIAECEVYALMGSG